MVGGAYIHLDDMLASQYQSIDWSQHTTCQSIHDSPMVHTRDREPVTKMVE